MKKILKGELIMQVVNIKHFVSDGDLGSGRSAGASRDIYIGRATSGRPASPLANPFPMRHESDRDASVAKYRVWLWNQMQIPSSPALAELNRIRQLASVESINLLCWCAPKKCHGDIIVAAIKYLEGVKS